MKKSASIILCCWIIGGLTACNMPLHSALNVSDQASQVQYQTVSAFLSATADEVTDLTLISEVPGTPLPSMTVVLEPTVQNMTLAVQPVMTRVAASSILSPCDLAQPGHPIDITMPDDTRVSPGQAFSKTWRLVNAGSCQWSQSYAVVWFSGDQLGVARTLFFSDVVDPGQYTDLTVEMVAPETPGIYQSNWKLQDEHGEFFGIGPNGDAPFWVRIQVVPEKTITPTTTPQPSITPTPKTSVSGSLILAIDSSADLDLGELNKAEGDDLILQQSPDQKLSIQALHGARLGWMGDTAPSHVECLSAPLTDAVLELDQVQAGAYLCYRTSAGLLGRMTISSSADQPDQLLLDYLTWAAP